MRIAVFLHEVLAAILAHKVASLLVGLLATAMVASAIATVGRTAAAEQQLAVRLDDAGSRVLSISDVRRQGWLTRSVVEVSGALSVTERAAGTTLPVDVVNGAVGQGATPAAARDPVAVLRTP